MKKLLFAFFAVIFLIVLAETGYYFYSLKIITLTQKLAPPTDRSIYSPIPTPTAYITAKILYQDPADTQGRTVLYQNNTLPYSGAGVIYRNASTSPEELYAIIGVLAGWEAIGGTSDKYILLKDPVRKTDLPKARVKFKSSPNPDDGIDNTVLEVENLNSGKLKFVHARTASIKEQDLGSLLKDGDAVVVRPNYDRKAKMLYDGKGVVFAGVLVLRRESGEISSQD